MWVTMTDTLDALTMEALRAECSRRGIAYPNGVPLHAACKHELMDALRSPQYVEALALGLIGKE